ncbi:DUF222 domain-containing protein [Saccharomonospora sp. NPDC046836]|uniref:DUF222 domain-containing protein n=1 Tax=Saccharomonospora sp. NPDC046836 TaxID=3156921 RepID=UPI0033F5506E
MSDDAAELGFATRRRRWVSCPHFLDIATKAVAVGVSQLAAAQCAERAASTLLTPGSATRLVTIEHTFDTVCADTAVVDGDGLPCHTPGQNERLKPMLHELSLEGLSGGDLVRTIQALQEEICRLEALRLKAVARLDDLTKDKDGLAKQLANILSVSETSAHKEIGLAKALTTRLPNTLEAMQRGDLDALKASKLAGPTSPLTDEQAREVDAVMATRTRGKTPSALRRSVNRAVAKTDPIGTGVRAVPQVAVGKVDLIHRQRGTVRLAGDLPVNAGVAAFARIDAEARRRRNDAEGKTLDQLRADVFADLLLQGVSQRSASRESKFSTRFRRRRSMRVLGALAPSQGFGTEGQTSVSPADGVPSGG